jgi:Xaa-Pro aminopeptidase
LREVALDGHSRRPIRKFAGTLPLMDYAGRLESLQKDVLRLKVDTLFITHPPNIRYLCGFTGSAGALLVSASATVFFSDGRYARQAKEEVKGAKIIIAPKAPLVSVGEWLSRGGRRLRPRSLGIESEHLTVAARKRLAALIPKGVRLREVPPVVEQARMVKDSNELEKIREAVSVGAGLFDRALVTIRPGVNELEVAAEMEYSARKAGVEGMSFETIVAAGVRSSLPHGRASAARIPARGFVVCDFGVILHGYCSDRTRTVWVGAASKEVSRLYAAVLEAQLAAIDSVRPGVPVSKVDHAARKTLQTHGLERHFTHSTGHGVGLEIHEAPRVAKGQQEILRPGMVITVEPGVYLPDKWGVRIEDMVVVTEHGCEVLAPHQKEFIAL